MHDGLNIATEPYDSFLDSEMSRAEEPTCWKPERYTAGVVASRLHNFTQAVVSLPIVPRP